MIEKHIEGLSFEATENVLKKASKLINNDSNSIRFKKQSCRVGRNKGLEYSIVKAEDERYFLLGHHKRAHRNQNHFLGQGSHSSIRIAYELIDQNDDGNYILGEKEYIVKKSRFLSESDESRHDAFKKTSKTWKYESKNTTQQFIEKNNGLSTHLLFTSRVKGNNLLHYLVNGYFSDISLTERLDYIVSLADQLNIKFHSENKVHRDLKPANVMLNPESKKIKIIDVDTTCSEGKIKRLTGTPYYIAHECAEIYTTKDRLGVVSKKQDIYAFGVMVSEILSADAAFNKNNYYYEHPSFRNKASGSIIDTITGKFIHEIRQFPDLSKVQAKELRCFLYRMTSSKPEKRPDIEEVADFFKRLRFESNINLIQEKLSDILDQLDNDSISQAVDDLLTALYSEELIRAPETIKAKVLKNSCDLLELVTENNDPEALNSALQSYEKTISDILKSRDLDKGLKSQIAGSMLVLLGVTSLIFAAAVFASFCLLACPALIASAPAIVIAAATLITSTGTALLGMEGLLVAGVSAAVVGAASVATSIGFFSKAAGKSRDVKGYGENLTEQAENLANAIAPTQ